jgi:phosphotransferase system enzyme I (PtsI)
MVTAIEELRWAKRTVEETKLELKRQGHSFDEKLQVGIMVEVPAAALAAKSLAKESDFFSIGTNDLTQYTLAVDRGNELVANLYSPANPAVLTLIRGTIEAANGARIPVSMCGEMAGDPIFTALLVGLGLTELSVAPPAIPEIKKIIRNVSYDKCREVAAQVNAMNETGMILEFLKERLSADLPGGEQFGSG